MIPSLTRAPLGPTLARILGGVYHCDMVRVDGHTITETFKGRVILDGGKVIATHSDGADLIAAKFRAAVIAS